MERWQIIIGIGIGIAIAALGGLPAFVGCSTRLWSSAPEYLVAARWTNRDSTFLTRTASPTCCRATRLTESLEPA